MREGTSLGRARKFRRMLEVRDSRWGLPDAKPAFYSSLRWRSQENSEDWQLEDMQNQQFHMKRARVPIRLLLGYVFPMVLVGQPGECS